MSDEENQMSEGVVVDNHYHQQPPPPPPQKGTFQGYAVAEGRPAKELDIPCCGIGIGWVLFIIGFFLGAIPWYAGFVLLICGRRDKREKPGLIACTVAATLLTIAIVIGVISRSVFGY